MEIVWLRDPTSITKSLAHFRRLMDSPFGTVFNLLLGVGSFGCSIFIPLRLLFLSMILYTCVRFSLLQSVRQTSLLFCSSIHVHLFFPSKNNFLWWVINVSTTVHSFFVLHFYFLYPHLSSCFRELFRQIWWIIHFRVSDSSI